MAGKKVTLRSPDGREYATTDAAEVTRLRARGYTTVKPKQAPKSEPKSDK